MKKSNKELSALILRAADYVGRTLSGRGCMVHRYDAFSTSSVYLKVDAGVACSIRLSDHEGHYNLKYRFNYLAQVPGEAVEHVQDGFDRYFYQAGAVDQMIEDILELREQRYLMYRNYDDLIKERLEESVNASGFWQGAYLISSQDLEAA